MDMHNKVDITSLMESATALYVNKPNALVNNLKTYITPERDVTPINQNGHTVIPVLFFANSIGAAVQSGADGSITLTRGETAIALKASENAHLISGTLYAPVTELCEAFGLYLFKDQSGVMIYGKRDLNLNWTTHKEELRKICETYVYDDVEGSEITALLKQNFPDCTHPRLVMTKEKFERIRAEYLKGEDCDPIYQKLIAKLKGMCDGYLTAAPMTYNVDPPYYLIDVGRAMNDRIMGLAMMYNITLDERYAARAREEMLAAAAFPNWDQTFMLACSEMTVGVAFGYDWLYDWLDESDKSLLRKALVDYAISMVQYDYDNVTEFSEKPSLNPIHRGWNWRCGKPTNNQIMVINGAMFSAAAAIADELEGDELKMAERTFSQSLLDLRCGLSLFAPDGGYEESMGYWEFCQEFTTYHLGTLLNITGGKDYGYLDAPGTRSMVDFLISANGPVSTFSYHDTTTTVADFPPQTMFWADVLGNPKNALPRIEHIMEGKGKLEDLYFYKPEFRKVKADNLALDYIYPTVGVASMRSGWGKKDIWVGFHADNAYGGPGHAHMDVGSFVMDAIGRQYFLDFGQDSYGLGAPYYIHAYRFRAEGHNTLVINPTDGYDQKFGGKAKIDKWVSKPQGAFAQTNLTDIYSDNVVSAWRGIKLDNNRTRVVLQDEITMKAPSDFYWFAHTAADVTISEDGKKAFLTIEEDVLCAEITSGERAVFSVMDAKPLPTTPDVPGQNPNKGVRKLVIHISGCENLNLSVVFYPDGQDKGNTAWVPLTEWNIED